MKSNCRKFLSHSDVGWVRGVSSIAKEIFTYHRVIANLIRQQITRSYLQAKLGMLWVVLAPVLTIGVLSLIFPLLMRNRMESFITYLFSGLVVYNFFSAAVNGSCNAIISREGLIKKIYLPNSIFPIVHISSEFVNLMITLTALHVLALVLDFEVHTSVLYVIAALLVTYLFCLGISFVVSIAATVVRDVQQVTGMLMRALFFLTPIIYPVSALPQKAQSLMELNPVFQYVRLFHETIYYGDDGLAWGFFLWPCALAAGSLFIGLIVQWRYGRNVIYYL